MDTLRLESFYNKTMMHQNMDTVVNITDTLIKEFIYNYKQYVNQEWINLDDIVQHIKDTVPEKMSYNDFYNYVADYCASKMSYHPDYNRLASRICIDRLHKNTPDDILNVASILYNNKDSNGKKHPLISQDLYETIRQFHDKINKELDTNRDYLFDYFGIRTLERSYLIRIYDEKNKKKIIERPQHLIMRVSIGLHGNNIDDALETYNLISLRYFTHATPTLFNAGTNRPQLASCFLLGIDDNLHSIYSQIKQMAMISKWSGGIGIHISNIRSKGSLIRGTNGISDGVIPMCIVMNKTSRHVNQGGKRQGSFACYLEPWHADIFEFCELRKANSGSDDTRAKDLFLALWIPDIFMRRVENDEEWSLMCPDECPNLDNLYGEEFDKLYIEYEKCKKYRKQVKARDLFNHIMECQIETGFPYMLYKDNVNNKSNQQNIGTIKSSNLCAEICEYSDGETTAVCNLASICLPRFITDEDGVKKFDYNKLMDVVRVIVRNLNKVININYYPHESTKKSNKKHRPIGIGVQGLADVYNIFGYPYGSKESSYLNKKIFETIYYASLDESKELAKIYGAYKSFKGSPFSKGILQFHMWNMTVDDLVTGKEYDWNKLIEDIKIFGIRNSLLTALMPTAGTSQIMKCYESFEPYMSNVFVRTTLAGEFIVINEKLVNDLTKLGLWSDDMRKKIIIYNGSIQNIDEIPENIKEIYKTAFEIKLKSILDQASERGPFIDQSQSTNLFMKNPNFDILRSAHFYGWKKGLKTGMYYLRTAPAVNPIQFGIDIDDTKRLTNNANTLDLMKQKSDQNKPQECLMCGS